MRVATRLLLVVPATVLAVSVLPGCGKSKSPTAGSAPSPAPTAAPTAAPIPSPSLPGTNRFSEHFDVFLGEGFVRRGEGIYRSTCWPAAF